jgi:hypothetical protein
MRPSTLRDRRPEDLVTWTADFDFQMVSNCIVSKLN